MGLVAKKRTGRTRLIRGSESTAFAQANPVIYPAKGQSPEQLEKDKYACYTWAKGQTGFDPMQAGSTPQAPPTTQGAQW